jgi:hypothetical protein
MSPAVELHIDALVLHGVPRSHAARVGEALERELTRLLEERGVPAAGAGETVAGGPARVKTSPEGSPEALGAEVAGAIHGRLWR